MTTEELQSLVLELWTRSRVPLSAEMLERASGASSRSLRKSLHALIKAGTLDERDGIYEVNGVERSVGGPETLEEWQHKRALLEEARARIRRRRGQSGRDEKGDAASQKKSKSAPREAEDEPTSDDEETGLALHRKAFGLAGQALGALDKPRGQRGKKSLKVSAALSLLGPVGWLYAGSFKEAVPGILLAVALGAVLPSFMLFPILWFAIPGSALAGLIYAWQYNRKGHRTPLFLEDKHAEASDEVEDL